MSDSDLPEDSGTATSEALSLEEAVSRNVSNRASEPAQAPETGQPEGDKPAAEPTEAQADEPEQEADDTPDWDKTDPEPEKEDAESPDGPKGDARFVPANAKVRLDDGRIVTVEQLKRGSLFQDDYTRKTQALAEERRGIESKNAEIEQLKQGNLQVAQVLGNYLKASLPKQPTREDYQADPIQAQMDMLAWQEAAAKLNEVHQFVANGTQQWQADYQRKMAEAVQARSKEEVTRLLNRMPQLNDPAKLKSFTSDITKTLQETYGFSAEDTKDLLDHRWVMVAADAMRFRRQSANKASAKAKSAPAAARPPVTKPGRRNSGTDASMAIKAAQERFNKTGSLEAATELAMARRRSA